MPKKPPKKSSKALKPSKPTSFPFAIDAPSPVTKDQFIEAVRRALARPDGMSNEDLQAALHEIASDIDGDLEALNEEMSEE